MATPRKFEAVTTFSDEGYKAYGRRMIEAFNAYWPEDVPLHVYSEAAGRGEPFPAWLDEFRARHAGGRAASGYLARGPSKGQYNYRFDALRFAFKTAAVIDSIETTTADILIWIDADTVTHSPVSIDFLRELAPDARDVISWLWRDKNYPECGFYMLNMRHPSTKLLAARWRELYESDLLFHLPEWHDSYVLAELVRTLQLSWRSISGAGSATGHPFINGPLGAVMDHMKGARKAAGRSSTNDLRVIRGEAYWRR